MWKWTVGKLINSPQERSISTIIYWETLMHNRLENKGMILSQIFATLISWSSKTLNGSSEFSKRGYSSEWWPSQSKQCNFSWEISCLENFEFAWQFIEGLQAKMSKVTFFEGRGVRLKWSQMWHNKGECQYILFQNGPISVFLCLLAN